MWLLEMKPMLCFVSHDVIWPYFGSNNIYVCAGVCVCTGHRPSINIREKFVGAIWVSRTLNGGHQAQHQPTLATETILWHSFVYLRMGQLFSPKYKLPHLKKAIALYNFHLQIVFIIQIVFLVHLEMTICLQWDFIDVMAILFLSICEKTQCEMSVGCTARNLT